MESLEVDDAKRAEWVYGCTARLMERDPDCPLYPHEWDELSFELFETMGHMEAEAAADAA